MNTIKTFHGKKKIGTLCKQQRVPRRYRRIQREGRLKKQREVKQNLVSQIILENVFSRLQLTYPLNLTL